MKHIDKIEELESKINYAIDEIGKHNGGAKYTQLFSLGDSDIVIKIAVSTKQYEKNKLKAKYYNVKAELEDFK